jgi:hypothetical protein
MTTQTDTAARHEREPFGITYDRLRLDLVFDDLLDRYPVQTVLEYPAEGAKAMPSIYSLGLAARGCDITLVNPSEQGLDVWRDLGLEDRFEVVQVDDLSAPQLPRDEWDLVWNFVSVGFRTDFDRVLASMVDVSRRYVLTVHCNAYNFGYPWHHFLHWALNLEWTHGETDYFWPHRVREAYRNCGAEPIDFGLFDMPGWPDPPGFRDVRLHLSGGDDVEIFDWSAPIAEFYRRGDISAGLSFLSRIESGPVPDLIRFVFSHLFFVLSDVRRSPNSNGRDVPR